MSLKLKKIKLVFIVALICIGAGYGPQAQAQQAKKRGASGPALMKIRARAGDTLASLAARFNFTSELLQRLNGRAPDELLSAGMEVYLPSKSGHLETAARTLQPAQSGGALPRKFPAGWSKEDRYRFLLPYIIEAARRNGVDPYLLSTVCDIETKFRPELTSPVGAMGLTQLMPGTAARFGVTDAYDARQALDGGAKYLRFLTDKFEGNLDLILAGYNAGEGAVMKYGGRVPPYNETRAYVARGRVAYLGYSQTRPTSYAPPSVIARLASDPPVEPASTANAAVEGELQEEEPVEPKPVTRSLVYGEGARSVPGGENENNQPPQVSRGATRSIRFQ